ncbi:YdbH domain-containing protein [Sphingosinicella sp. LHD-64]|uniref:intermembrane phospholipid transport protein YdbH family protein n=1 Tax=Sphingosinicella sp. LHD-64 TaxID=3072139 RepID=UPI00280F5742|nr:YdbH domain-containing protein [Sphingosinicella sp. LHD-64]MDQ8756413.1 YdbH domain-containing protein [Sphingosinicella sp. LHD-64]
MEESEDIGETVGVRRWPRRLRRGLAVLLVLLLVALAVAWILRERLATDYIEGELARRGVDATYEVKRIGLGSQILENVVIGDRARPDATVRHLEVQVVLGLGGPEIGLVTARGVRLRGRIDEDGRLSLGQIDRLLPPPTGVPFELPDQRIDVADAAIALETPAGFLAVAVEGRGNLADGFAGRLALAANRLTLGGCTVEGPRADLAAAVDDRHPAVRGPVSAARFGCGDDLVVERPLLAVNTRLGRSLDIWQGGAAARIPTLVTRAGRLNDVDARLTLDGNALRTQGRADLSAGSVEADAVRTRRARIAGPYVLSLRRSELVMTGDLQATGVVLPERTLAGAAGSLRAMQGTPLGPIGDNLARALVRAGQGGAIVNAGVRLAVAPDRGGLGIGRLRLTTASGARLLVDGGSGATYGWPGGGLALDGDFALTGGGFPDARFTLRQARAGGPIRGTGRVAPLEAAGARLALGAIDFASASGGNTRFSTTARLDGPFSGGRVEGLLLPLSGRFGRGGLALGESCVAASFQALEVQNLRLGATRLPLCPVGRALVSQQPGGALQGGAEVRAPRFAGRLGSSPITLAASRLRVGLDGFTAADLAARLGASSGESRLDIAGLDGRLAGGGVAGGFTGLAGDLAGVPLLVSEGSGRWRFAGGTLNAEGALTVADRQDPLRFQPLVTRDFRLAIAGNDLRAAGGLDHPESGTRVMRATIDHDLGTGAGGAVLDVAGLRFQPRGFQPDALTPLTVGVVALVDGTVTGRGRIAWDAEGTRSSGTFATQDMNLAAPFGPVEGLTTTLNFTDLLGLVTAPGQTAEVRLIQAGIDVYDGRVTYQLQPDYRVAVDGARWPFSGGTLSLEPTVLDFSRETTKYLTFRVEGLDAASFIAQMEFGNIAATGTFDGIVPMQFDANGTGEIRDGRLTARPEGGTLSYVGELTDRDLGAYGILAFNALKSLRYDKFDLTLNGALDGEFITVIDLDGIARDPSATTLPGGGGIPQMVAGRILNQLARIPFEFNIRIQGQFRSLFATAQSFSDPTLLIQSVLPDRLIDTQNTPAVQENGVQPEESEPVR